MGKTIKGKPGYRDAKSLGGKCSIGWGGINCPCCSPPNSIIKKLSKRLNRRRAKKEMEDQA